MPIARTVLGDIPVERLGVTLTREHITYSWGTARRDLGEHYDREAIVKRIAESVGAAKRNHGVNTVVCVSTPALGRDIDTCAEVSRRTGVNIIASTGAWRQSGGTGLYWIAQSEDVFEKYLTKEITVGVGRNQVKCGHISMAWDSKDTTHPEEKFFRVAGRVSKQLHTAMSLHCDYGEAPLGYNPGVHTVEILTGQGADPSRIKVDNAGSAGGNLAPLLDVLRRGVYLGFQDLFRSVEQDNVLAGTIGALVAAGYAKQIMLSPQAMAPGWITKQPTEYAAKAVQNHSYLHKEIVPRLLKGGLKEKDVEQILVANPRNFLGF